MGIYGDSEITRMESARWMREEREKREATARAAEAKGREAKEDADRHAQLETSMQRIAQEREAREKNEAAEAMEQRIAASVAAALKAAFPQPAPPTLRMPMSNQTDSRESYLSSRVESGHASASEAIELGMIRNPPPDRNYVQPPAATVDRQAELQSRFEKGLASPSEMLQLGLMQSKPPTRAS